MADIAYISAELRRQAEEILAAFEDRGQPEDADPRGLLDAFEDLLAHLSREAERKEGISRDDDKPCAERDLCALGDHGIDLLARLSAIAGRLHRPQQARAVEGLTLPLACWVARRGGEIGNLAPVVNAVAALANSLRTPADLERLYGLASEVIAAVNPQFSQDTASVDPTRPWRILLLNRAIVATRSHQPALMQEAFEHLVEHLPQDAPEFFREGMEQMEALNYPSQVRVVMAQWHGTWCLRHTLH